MVVKKLKKVVKKVVNQGSISKLTRAEREVLDLISREYLTSKQVTIRRKTTQQATSKLITSLKKKGCLGMVVKSQGTIQPKQPLSKIRYHGEEFNIKLLFKDSRYKTLLKKCNILDIDGNTVRLYRDSIEIYSGQSFYADTPQKAVYNSIPYWNRFMRRLEHDLSVILVKHRYQNIKIVKAHISEINNEIAKDYEVRGDKLRIYAKEDGKLWLTIDNSFNLHELELQHPETVLPDTNKVLKQVNDWREHDPPTLSDIMKVLKETSGINKETSAGLNVAVKLLLPDEPTPSNDKHASKEEKDVSYFG